MPGGFTDKLEIFETLLVLRCFRIDRITVALTVSVFLNSSIKYVYFILFLLSEERLNFMKLVKTYTKIEKNVVLMYLRISWN